MSRREIFNRLVSCFLSVMVLYMNVNLYEPEKEKFDNLSSNSSNHLLGEYFNPTDIADTYNACSIGRQQNASSESANNAFQKPLIKLPGWILAWVLSPVTVSVWDCSVFSDFKPVFSLFNRLRLTLFPFHDFL